MKKSIVFLFLALLLLGAAVLTYPTARAAEIEHSGTWENLSWTLDSEGVLTFSGGGELGSDADAWRAHADSVISIVIEDGVTSIGDSAFYGCTSLRSVTLPDSVTSIGWLAFSECGALMRINVPNSVTSIGDYAFEGCSSLTQITLPDDVTGIGWGTFSGCSSLTGIVIPAGVTEIASSAFSGCSSLTQIAIPDSVTSIGDYVFEGCSSLERITIPGGVTEIGEYAFYECKSLKNISLPDGVTSIGCFAFGYCSSLTDILIPSSVTSISEFTFYGCDDLSDIVIPEGVTEIGTCAFVGCTSLTRITIPDSVTSIGNEAFFTCKYLRNITIPAGVTSIGALAFYKCELLEDVYYALDEAAWNAAFGANDDLGLSDVRLHWNVTNPQGHWGAPVILPATVDAVGSATYTCPCGHSYAEELPRLEGEAEQTPAISYNYNNYNYNGNWSTPIGSYLTWEDGGYTRLEYIDDMLVVERYDEAMQFVSRRDIPLELYAFGGVYLCEDYNFVVVGQANREENNRVEVIRVVCYTKDWVRVGSAGLFGANTYIPFDAGSLRFARKGDMLYIRTSHEMYASSDGRHHQANVTICVDIPTMTVTGSKTSVSHPDYGYVSHSFNQFILVDGDDVLAVDHGDAYPRSVVLFRYDGSGGTLDFNRNVPRVNVLNIAGGIGENYTGVAVGGFEYSDTHYLVAGNSIVQEETDASNRQRNIFIAAVPKDDFTDEAVTLTWLTDYAEGDDVSLGTPFLVKLNDGRFFMIWAVDDTLSYCFLTADGKLDGEIFASEGALSDCAPLQRGTQLVWYVTKNSTPVFYTLDLENPAQITVTATHQYETVVSEPTCTEPGSATYTCVLCGYSYTQQIPATGHSYEAVTTAPTCTAAGYNTYTCHCGDSYVADEVPALGHSYVEGTCQRCGAVELELGDINGDGNVNARDVRALLNALASGQALDAKAADINGDGSINARDIRALLQLLAGPG